MANFFSLNLNLMEKNEFKNIEKTLKKIVNLNEISHLNHTKFIKILKQDKKIQKIVFD